MATTTATLTLNSSDITGHSFNMTQTSTLTKAGNSSGLDEFTGITSRIYSAAQTDTVIVADSIYADTTGDWMLIPYGGSLDIQVTTVATGVTIEYAVFSQSTAS